MFCTKCGAKLEADNKFCPACGKSVVSDAAENKTSTQIKGAFSSCSNFIKSVFNNSKTRKKGFIALGAIAAVIIGIVIISSLSSSVPNIKQLKTDLPYELTGYYFDGQFYYMDVKKFVIERRQTNNKTDTVYCTVELENYSIHRTAYCQYTYNYFDKGGWILEYCYEYKPAVMKAIKGVPSKVIDRLQNELFNTYDTVDLVSQKTDIDKQRDVITFNIYNKDAYSEVKGDIVCDYRFNGFEWEMNSTESQTTRTLHGGLTDYDVSSLEQDLKYQYDEITQTTRNTDLDSGTDFFVYKCINKYPYYVESTDIAVNYSFYPNNSWISNGIQTGMTNGVWSIKGTWKYSECKNNTYSWAMLSVPIFLESAELAITEFDGLSPKGSFTYIFKDGEVVNGKLDDCEFWISKGGGAFGDSGDAIVKIRDRSYSMFRFDIVLRITKDGVAFYDDVNILTLESAPPKQN